MIFISLHYSGFLKEDEDFFRKRMLVCFGLIDIILVYPCQMLCRPLSFLSFLMYIIINHLDVRRRIELIQDFEMPTASTNIEISQDGNYVLASGNEKFIKLVCLVIIIVMVC